LHDLLAVAAVGAAAYDGHAGTSTAPLGQHEGGGTQPQHCMNKVGPFGRCAAACRWQSDAGGACVGALGHSAHASQQLGGQPSRIILQGQLWLLLVLVLLLLLVLIG
jgi:hypothetical protein